MDKTKIIKKAQELADYYPSGMSDDINENVLNYIMEEVWELSAAKGMKVVEWKEEVLLVVGFRKFIEFESDIDEFAINKVHKKMCFIYNFEMYVA